MARKKIEAPPLAPAVKWADHESVEGQYVGARLFSKEERTLVHDFENAPEGSEYANEERAFTLWGTVDLDRKLKQIEVGTYVYVTYMGEDGRVKRFDVEVDE